MRIGTRNFAVISIAAALFGLSMGVYDLLFPYFLDELGMSFENMGITFSLASLFIAFSSVYIASASDIWGRKYFYSVGMVSGCIASVMAPILSSFPFLVISKTLRESAMRFRQTIQGTLIYEFAPKKFPDLFAKSRGIEYLSEAGGNIAAGTLLVILGFSNCFYLSGTLLGLSMIVFVIGFREKRQKEEVTGEHLGLSEMFSLDMPRGLALISISSFIFAVGLSTSHNFIMPLFFSKKFGAPVEQVSLILALHRLSLALPLLFSGIAARFSLKKVYIGALLYEGLALTAAGLLPNLIASAGIWLTHDLLGAALWMPVQATLIQRFARKSSRGSDVSKVRAIGYLGWVIGPLIAGWTSPISISLPFVLSGILVLLSAIPIIPLSTQEPEKPIEHLPQPNP